jgi:hypothetical protein
MMDLQEITDAHSWLKQINIDDSERKEIHVLLKGREMLYAQVDQPKCFISDIKPKTGRLTDFNKGMMLYIHHDKF